ncbi:MAG: SDR family oxidoreductase [Pseudomonadota bacterium]|nr:SDR family oxidoreductase [Pseudomonadota bacterium]
MLQALRRHVPPPVRTIDLNDRVVVLTGGSRGLGLELARVFLGEGARVALLARDPRELERAANLLGHPALLVPCDVTDPEQVKGAVARVVERYGRVDVLVNNAGTIEVGPFEHMLDEDWEVALDVHLRAPLNLVRACLPHMAPGGRIANVSSIGGLVAVPHLAPYCASKHALVGLSDTLRAELAPRGIAVTTVCPWLMRTGSPPHVLVKGRHEEEYRWFVTMDTLPVVSQRSGQAARRIVRAIRRGDARVVTAFQGRLAVALDAVAPGFFAWTMRVFETFLPRPAAEGGEEGMLGAHLRAPEWARPRLAEVGRRNNE